jgi:DDE superfamily endonuclease
VYNADQTNVYYSMEGSYTWAETGTKNVPIRGADSTQRLTVLLCANMEGGKVAPYLIFKGKDGDRGRVRREVLAPPAGYPVSCIYAVQAKAWMDEDKMLDWIRRVW